LVVSDQHVGHDVTRAHAGVEQSTNAARNNKLILAPIPSHIEPLVAHVDGTVINACDGGRLFRCQAPHVDALTEADSETGQLSNTFTPGRLPEKICV